MTRPAFYGWFVFSMIQFNMVVSNAGFLWKSLLGRMANAPVPVDVADAMPMPMPAIRTCAKPSGGEWLDGRKDTSEHKKPSKKRETLEIGERKGTGLAWA